MVTTTNIPDFFRTFNQRRWTGVLDPTLALSNYGLPLVKQLGAWMELWIVREFWHILDNPQFYLRQPDAIAGHLTTHLSLQQQRSQQQQVMRSLKEWERLRTTRDRHTWQIHFLADVIGESCVPPGTEPDLIWRWESLAQSLDTRLDEHLTQTDTLTLAFRDLAALAAARPACILTHRYGTDPPQICQMLAQWGIPCQEVAPGDAIAHFEREQFYSLLVHAGLAKFLWAGLQLVVLHLVVPAATTLHADQDWSEDFPLLENLMEVQETPVDLWQAAQGFWYSI